ncbi:MAG: HAD hydrolase-like protein [Clostridia bacterium]|nr:HAD hydrolase-like protein [Clostridia bacterium]
MIDRVIWDFNGTILDDLKISIESADELLSRYDLPVIGDVEKYYSVFGFPIIGYYERVGFDFSKYDFSVLANEWVDIYLSKMPYATLREGIIETVDKLNSLGIKQTILSMTEENMLRSQIASFGITEKFDEIYGLNDIYATSKLELARYWRSTHENETVLYVGDTEHDAESAEIIDAKCLMITSGHQSEAKLIGLGKPVITATNDIFEYIK